MDTIQNDMYTYDEDEKVLTINKMPEAVADEKGNYSYPWESLKGKVKKIVIADYINHIPKRAFANCHNLTSISLPETITSIAEEAFATCYKLNDLTIPGECKVATNAFRNCFTLEIVNALKAEFGSFAASDKNLQPLIENLLYYLKDCYNETDLLSRLPTALKQIYDIFKVKESSVQIFRRLISLLLPLWYQIQASDLIVRLNSIYNEINEDTSFENIDNISSLLHFHKF